MDESDTSSNVQFLLGSISPKIQLQYKYHFAQYINWCRNRNLLDVSQQQQQQQQPVTDEDIYRRLPISCFLIHWFIIDTFIINVPTSNSKLPTSEEIEKIIKSLKFLDKLCHVAKGNIEYTIDPRVESYLNSIPSIYSQYEHMPKIFTLSDNDDNNNNNNNKVYKLLKTAVNLWNPNTTHLKNNEPRIKLQFLLTLQLSTMYNITYDEQFDLLLSNFQTRPMIESSSSSSSSSSPSKQLPVIYGTYTRNNTSKKKVNGLKTLEIIPQNCPFICPIMTLATYYFLRFYILKDYKFPMTETDIEHFPFLHEEHADDEEVWQNSLTQISEYCQFTSPLSSDVESNDSNNIYFTPDILRTVKSKFPEAFDVAFKDDIPLDLNYLMNLRNPIHELNYRTNETNNNTYFSIRKVPPNGMLFQLFPEIEILKGKLEGSASSPPLKLQNFIQLMEALRLIFVSNLPFIYEFFPDHDIFKYPVLQREEFRIYLNSAKILSSGNNNNSEDTLPFRIFPDDKQCLTRKSFTQLIIEPSSNLASIVTSSLKDTIRHVDTDNSVTNNESKTLSNNNLQEMLSIANATKNAPKKRTRSKTKAQENDKTNTIKSKRRKHTSSERDISEDDTRENSAKQSLINIPQSITTTSNNQQQSVMTNELTQRITDEEFQFMQLQTMTNFQNLVGTLTKIFDEVPVKKPVKHLITKQLNSFNDSMFETLNFDPMERHKFVKNQIIKHSQQNDFEELDTKQPTRRTGREKSLNLMDISDDDDDDDDEEEDKKESSSSSEDADEDNSDSDDDDDSVDGEDNNMQEELKYLINELVTTRVNSIFKNQMNQFARKFGDKIETIVENIVNQKIHDFANTHFNSMSTPKGTVLSRAVQQNNHMKQKLNGNATNANASDGRHNSFMSIPKDAVVSNTSSPYISSQMSTPKLIPLSMKRATKSMTVSREKENIGTQSFEDGEVSAFQLDETINTIDGIVKEWFQPNPKYNNESIHSLNKSKNKSWRKHVSAELYKERKVIVEFVVYLMNEENFERKVAIKACELIRDNKPMSALARLLRDWKRDHRGNFSGLSDQIYILL
ncbi:Cbf2p NDAI_0I02760 [Naumovozyma dairenensis CBS 421]|uniref:Uncharacterized protein n=1 Tax=Naumovozyma dairenensis (strain ATCC 10597 / BCRC 20456 / CBS 421 / NBRC 0211 / NRRL Y-12639) TaxID=1071378 RepID=G0WGD3_NAUDC|nr:hypothetical protein NDAI_0I02760 [Naumovozyma dairenensis CBS 421]CCD26844.1 hypothetical protein NDAI_0I02760 [Naumovozyma dairenensis CBS 421]